MHKTGALKKKAVIGGTAPKLEPLDGNNSLR
jgi:hypothetical protein